MTTAAIICEYNPFHNGHLYQVQKIKEELHADFIIGIMSGNFVQRGIPAFYDKFSRAKTALECGLDLIIELPVRYATSSAEYFASGAVYLLDSLNFIDFLVFGTEDNNLALLEQYATLFLEEPEDFKILLKNHLRSGLSYPAARQVAASNFLSSNDTKLLEKPNNILAIEYLKALKKYHSDIRPYGILRRDSGYHHYKIDSTISSATSIRAHMQENGFDSLVCHAVPPSTRTILETEYGKSFPVSLDDFSDMIFYRLMMEKEPEHYLDYHPEMMDRILRYLPESSSVEHLIALVKSKNFTYGRIARYLLHLLLNINNVSIEASPSYIKVLGFRKSSSFYFKELRCHSSLPVIQKTSHYRSILNAADQLLFEEDLHAASIYNYAVRKRYGILLPDDEKRPLLIV